MRALVNLTLALLLVVVTTADRVACNDGCADEAATERAESPAPSICGLCHGWHAPADPGQPQPTERVARRTPERRAAEYGAHTHPVYHPPRAA